MTHRYEPFKYAQKLGFGELHFKMNEEIDLFSIIAVHSTKRGPAIGGCRWISYENVNAAIYDALRLARSMSFKSAVSDLPQGGAKSVIMYPSITSDKFFDKEKYFETYAKFVHELGGIYITATDSGTTSAEMDIISRYTPYVSSTSAVGNPAVFTAHGVLRGIEAAVQFKLNKSSLEGLHISIQGLGQVGYLLAKLCHERGVKLTVADIKTELVVRAAQEFNANVVSYELIHSIPTDVFSPCALGGILNHETISQIHSPIIAGSANNQLADPDSAYLLHRLKILYAPDYVINAGGVIQASGKYHQISDKLIEKKVDNIYQTLMTIFQRSLDQHRSTSDIADELALEMMEKPPTPWR